MFDWCKKVEIHNVENHFHFYFDSKEQVFAKPPAEIPKFKAAPIQLSTHQRTKSKTLPNAKKGLAISRRLVTQQNHSSTVYPVWKPASEIKITDDQSTDKPFTPYPLESLISVRTEQSEMFSKPTSRLRQPYKCIHPATQDISERSRVNIQKIGSTQKPNIQSVQPKIQCQVVPPLKLKNLSSTMEETYFSANKNPNSCSQEKIRESLNIKEVGTSLNLNSLIRLSNKNVQQQLESKEVSLSGSSCSITARNPELAFDKKSRINNHGLRPRNPLKEASVILSQILSRDSTSQVFSEDHRPRKSHLLKVTHFWQDCDRFTIVSKENQQGSQKSARIQESIIYQRQFKHNFQILEESKFQTDYYTLTLGIEVDIGCIVSLKEINLSKMNLIAAELNAYNFVGNQKSLEEVSKNILQLYQVQMSEGSYLLIKQPYIYTIYDIFMNLSAPQQQQLVQTLKENMFSILKMFQTHSLYPDRLIGLEDFVQCCDVVKLHDLSVFREMDKPKFSIQEVMDHFETYLFADSL